MGKKIKKINYMAYLTGACLGIALLLGGEYRLIGLVGFLVSIFAFALLGVVKKKVFYKNPVNSIIFINVAYYVFQMMYSLFKLEDSILVFSDSMRYFLVYSLIFMLYNANLPEKVIDKILISVCIIFCIILLLGIIQVGFRISSLEENKFITTQIGADMFLIYSMYCIVNQKRNHTILCLGVLLLTYKTQARTAFIVCLVFVIVRFILQRKYLSQKVKIYAYWMLIAVCLLIPYVYIWLSRPKVKIGRRLDFFVTKYTGHQLFSGRNVIWQRVYDDIKEHYFWGNGIGYRIKTTDIYPGTKVDLSTHNLFLHIILQVGIIGLVLFCIFLFLLWKQWASGKSYRSKCMIAFMSALLIQQVFSLGLVSGKMGYAICTWSLLMLQMARCYVGDKETNKGY